MLTRWGRAALLTIAVALAAPAGAAAAPDLDGVSGPRPAALVDLAGTWDLTPAGGRATTIEVPGGGWVKQGFDVPRATYRREIAVPDVAPGQVTKLELAAVNHQATLRVDGKVVGTQTTSYTPQVYDLSGHVRPGGRHVLELDVRGRNGLTTFPYPGGTIPGYAGPTYLVPTGVEWSEGIPQGLFGSARLAIYPAVHVADAFVRPSVERRTLSYDVWIANGSPRAREVRLDGALAPAPGAERIRYPRLRSRTVTIPARATAKVTVGPVAWKAGRDSYWWPNVPYRKGYRAQLHDLRLGIAKPASKRRCTTGTRRKRRACLRRRRAARRKRLGGALYRFGFREARQARTHYELNGVRVNFRGDSLSGPSYDRIDHGGKGDAFHTYPGFLPPSPRSPGWPRAVDNYQRLNFSVVRIHQQPASPYMLDVADEMGLMLIGETGIRGSQQRQDFAAGREHMLAHTRDLVRRDRNHAAILRWSQANEPDADQRDSVDLQRALYDTIMAEDPTRPISVDVTSNTYEEIKAPNFSVFQHYVNENPSPSPVGGYTEDVHPRDDRPFGKGEFLWPLSATPQVFTWFGTATEKMREKDASDIRPYAMASTWPAVVPGVRSTDYVTEENTKILYGEDNLPDPWRHRVIRRVQQGFHPVLVADRDYWEAHKLSDPAGNWPTPTRPVAIRAGAVTRRALVVFNDTFDGERIDVRWQLRDGAADGPVVAEGAFAADVPLGSRRTHEIAFAAPRAGRRVRLVLTAAKPGQGELFREEDQVFDVTG